MEKTVFIHIGKCGGSTVRMVIPHHEEVHLRPVIFSKNDNYFIVIRNPIERFISAFYYRKLMYRKSVQKRFFEKENIIFSSTNNIYQFTENLFNYNIEDVKGVAHIGESISYYLEPIIDNLNKENVKYIFTTHYMDTEIKNVIPNYTPRKLKDNSENKPKKKLSDLSLKNLNIFLEKDFEMIEKLNDKGLLSQKQYEILSRRDGW